MRMNWSATLGYIAGLLVAASQITAYSTKDGKIVDDSGKEIQLKGVNWFGFNTGNAVLHGLWTSDFKCHANRIKALGFNAVRLPFTFSEIENKSKMIDILRSSCTNVRPDGTVAGQISCNAGFPTNSYDAFTYVIDYFTSIGLYVMPDNHYEDDAIMRPASFVESWKKLATRFSQNELVIGWDLVNEADKRGLLWDKAGNGPAYGPTMIAASDALMAINPKKLVFIEGVAGSPIGANWGDGFCTDAALAASLGMSNPIATFTTFMDRSYISQIVISPHIYGLDGTDGNSNTQGSALWDRLQKSFGVLNNKGFCVANGTCHAFPIAIGEFGGRFLVGGGHAPDVETQRDLAIYMNKESKVAAYNHKPITSWFYWCWNPNSGNTGGILADDWQTLVDVRVKYLQGLGLGKASTATPPTTSTPPVITTIPPVTTTTSSVVTTSVPAITTTVPTAPTTPPTVPSGNDTCSVTFIETSAPNQWHQFAQFNFNISLPASYNGAGWNMTYVIPNTQKGQITGAWNADVKVCNGTASVIPVCSEKRGNCGYPWQQIGVANQIGFITAASSLDRSVEGNTPTDVKVSLKFANGTASTVQCSSSVVLVK